MTSDGLDFSVVPSSSPAAQSIVQLALDELDRIYGPETDRAPFEPGSFDAPKGAFIVARAEGHLVAGAGIRTVGPAIGEVKRLWVRPDRRRSGLASDLMAELEKVAVTMGLTTLVLETGPLQHGAVALYRARGWTQTKELPVPLSCYDEAIGFVKQLS